MLKMVLDVAKGILTSQMPLLHEIIK